MCAHHVREQEVCQNNADNNENCLNPSSERHASKARLSKTELDGFTPNNNEAFCLETGEGVQNNAEEQWSKRMSRMCDLATMIFGWIMGALVVLFLASITFGIFYSGIHYHGDSWHGLDCVTPYNTILGVSNGVFAYSNCRDSHVSEEWGSLEFGGETRSGMKWQCVEYARRYWMLRGAPERATFESVDGAADIWALDSVRLLSGATRPLAKHRNGDLVSPRVGDLLIYPRQSDELPLGHVAVVVGVTANSVLVAEQNWGNDVWPGPHHNYSREIPLFHNSTDQTYTLRESENIIVQGWVRYDV